MLGRIGIGKPALMLRNGREYYQIICGTVQLHGHIPIKFKKRENQIMTENTDDELYTMFIYYFLLTQR